MHGKLVSFWMGPFIIRDMAGPNSFHLSQLDDEPMSLPVNGQLLKLFFTKDSLRPKEASSVT